MRPDSETIPACALELATLRSLPRYVLSTRASIHLLQRRPSPLGSPRHVSGCGVRESRSSSESGPVSRRRGDRASPPLLQLEDPGSANGALEQELHRELELSRIVNAGQGRDRAEGGVAQSSVWIA